MASAVDTRWAELGLASDERRRFGRLGGLMLALASLLSIPAGMSLDPAPAVHMHAIGLAGVVVGAVIYFVRWDRLSDGWLYAIPVIGTAEVVCGVLFLSDDFAFYQVLIAIWTAYVATSQLGFVVSMGCFTASVTAPLFLGSEEFIEQAHHVLVILPVMLIAAGTVRFLRDALSERERAYHGFAQEAIALANRIRTPASEPDSDLALRLDELSSRSRQLG